MKTLMLGAFIGSVLTILIILALALPHIELFEDGSFIYRASLPLSQAWLD